MAGVMKRKTATGIEVAADGTVASDYVLKAGDTMTGALTIDSEASQTLTLSSETPVMRFEDTGPSNAGSFDIIVNARTLGIKGNHSGKTAISIDDSFEFLTFWGEGGSTGSVNVQGSGGLTVGNGGLKVTGLAPPGAGATNTNLLLEAANPKLEFHDNDQTDGDGDRWWFTASGGAFYLLANRDTADTDFDTPHPFVYDLSADTATFAGDIDASPTINALSFTSDWGNYGSGYQGGVYWKVGGIVYLAGLVKRATTGTVPSVIATLPVGYRPSGHHIFINYSTWSTSPGVRTDVRDNGDIQTSGDTGVGEWVSLAGISFPAA